MKQKIIAAIKAKYPNANLSNIRFDEITAKIIKKVADDETKIDAAIDDFNEYNDIIDLAKTDDTIRDLKAKKPATEKKDGEDSKDPKPADDATDKDTPEWAKKLFQSNQDLMNKVTNLEKEKGAVTIRQKVTDSLKEIPVNYWAKRLMPEKDEDIEVFTKDVQNDYTQFQQDLKDQGISMQTTPGGSTKGGNTTKATDAEISNVLDNVM